MSMELCRVTVRGGGRMVDLTLPATVPVIEFTPTLAQLCEAGERDGLPPAWSLARAGSRPLDLSRSLADGGVANGDVLHLVDVSAWRSPVVVDLDDTVAGVIEADGNGEREGLAAGAVSSIAAAHLVAAAAVGALAAGSSVAAGIRWALGACVLLALAVVARVRLRRQPTASALGAGAWAFAGLAGCALAGSTGGVARLAGAAAGITVAALATVPVTLGASSAVALGAGALAISSGALAAGARPAQAAAVAVALGVLTLRVLPLLVSLWLPGQLAGRDRDRVEVATRRSRELLAGLSAGLIVTIVGAAVVLVAAGDGFAVALAASAGLALLLRAWSYRFAAESLPPLVAAGVVLLAVEAVVAVRDLAGHGLGEAGVALLTATGIVLAALAGRRHGASERVDRLWVVVDVSLLPLALATLGVFDAAARLTQDLVS